MTTIVGGEKTEQHLCSSCCQKHKQALTMVGMNTLLASLLQSATAPTRSEQTLLCPDCGQSFEAFSKAGTLGCAKCYSAFRPRLKPMLERIHGRVQHAGRVPRHTEEMNHLQQRLERLRRDMDRAVVDEDFERAATLRDEIRAMQPAREEGEESHA